MDNNKKQITNKFSPSLLSANFTKLGEELDATAKAGAPYVHIDVMDGVFVGQISLGMPIIKSMRKVSDLFFDVHLMIVDPIRYIPAFAECGADLITFHVEAAENPDEVIDAIHAAGKKAGISVKPGTPFEAVVPYLNKVELFLIMTVEPGFGGQKFMADMLPKIRSAAQYREENNLSFDIEVDGGIKKENVHLVLEAGANVIVAGSAAYNEHSYDSIKEFVEILQNS